MTVVINYVSKYISVIAIDTRIVYGRDGGKFGNYSDNNEKLISLKNMGWTSGAGLSDFLDDFKNRIANDDFDEPKNVNDYMGIYRKCLKDGFNKHYYFKEDIEKSVVSFSYLGISEQDVSMRIGILSSALLAKCQGLPKVENDSFFIFYPTEYLENQNLVLDFSKKYPLNYQFDGYLGNLLMKIALMFNEIKCNSNSVSNICDIGMYILNQDGIFKIRVKERIDILVEDLQKNQVEEKMQIISNLVFNEN